MCGLFSLGVAGFRGLTDAGERGSGGGRARGGEKKKEIKVG